MAVVSVDQKWSICYNTCIVKIKEQKMTTVNYKVGDDVSHAIGGDRYYDGKIARITKRFIFTDRGTKYTQKIAPNGDAYYTQTRCKYCYLIPGVQEYMDPHF